MKSPRYLGLALVATATLVATNAAHATFAGDPLFGTGLSGWTISAEQNFDGTLGSSIPGNATFASSVTLGSAPATPGLPAIPGVVFNSLSGTSMAILSTAGSNTLTGTEIFQDFGPLGTSQAVQVNIKLVTQDPVAGTAVARYSTLADGALDPLGFQVAFGTMSSLTAPPAFVGLLSQSGWLSFVVPQGTQSVTFDLFANLGISGKGQPDYLLIDTMAVAVPEPSTYALMLAGLGLLGWAARRRQVSA